jgi:hypothetical protein
LISADGAPGFLVTSMVSDAVRPALSTCSQEDESEATLESPGAGDTGPEAAAAGVAAAGGDAAVCVREEHASSAAHTGKTRRRRETEELNIIYLALGTCLSRGCLGWLSRTSGRRPYQIPASA